jgi:ubiquinone/menaquinone biosynthesis C-methylase UbiE
MSDAQNWDKHADTYEEVFAPLTSYMALWMWKLAEGRIRAGSTILDVACGSGALTLPAARWQKRAANGGKIFATDFSPEMVARTGQHLEAQGLSDGVVCEVQDGEALTYGDSAFDAVFSAFGIFLFPNRIRGFQEAGRVLRSGGLFATTVWRGPEQNPMIKAQMTAVGSSLPERLRVPSPPGGWLEIADQDALVREVTSLGLFADVAVFPLHGSIVLPSAERTTASLRENPVMARLFANLAPEEAADVTAKVTATFAQMAGGLGKPFILDAVCNVLLATRR